MAVKYRTAAANSKLTDFEDTKDAVVNFRKAMRVKPGTFGQTQSFNRSLLSFIR